MSPPLSLRPLRTALVWQAGATLVIAALAGALAGVNGALSALLGGLINVSAGVVYAFVVRLSPVRTPGATVMGAVRAEAAKIIMILGQLWLVMSTYRDLVLPALFAAFIITVLLFRVALFVRD
ncbi:MAG TPA: ATP synthase subunit I [Casimicrobiaceae bacterium]|nr:ATP synthase subunit I [Casimicrobiaceae bacterium]